MKDFLPVSREDMEKRGWDGADFVLITGDAYVDHPSFGAAVIGRVLESHGYKVAVLAQPDWRGAEPFRTFGRPRLGFLITAGNIDSMVNHYTAAKKRRHDDLYSPGGKSGFRPDRASIVYSQRVREAYGDVPIVLGGLEASLRRLAHYDYWDDKIRRSILMDSDADLIVYGMGEKPIAEIAEAMDSGLPIGEITFVKGTVYKTRDRERPYRPVILPDFEELLSSKETFAKSFMTQYGNMDSVTGRTLAEPYGNLYVVQNPPGDPVSQPELDRVYALPYLRAWHPVYDGQGGIPALEEVKFSLISNRGCFGGCNFCALTFHQGRVVQSRSHKSILTEAEQLTFEPDFKGYIHDVGGPTANFRGRACEKQEKYGVCPQKQCLFPEPCRQLIVDHGDYLSLLRKLRKLPKVKKVFIRSGLRYDYLIYDKDDAFFRELCEHHISGQLKVAPEHVSAEVLQKMGKPRREVYDRFVKKYYQINEELGKNQYLVPYLMSSHPGSTLRDAVELAEYLRDLGYHPEQVQDFYPTPGTLSTCMYYTGLDPRTMQPVYVPKTAHEKAMQRALLQYRNPANYALVYEALAKARRLDLVGFGGKCLIRPRQGQAQRNPAGPPRQKGRSRPRTRGGQAPAKGKSRKR